MNAVDREIFEFDMSDFDWGEYIKKMVHGVRFLVNKSSWDTVAEGLAEYEEF